jgi:hypothetical protein
MARREVKMKSSKNIRLTLVGIMLMVFVGLPLAVTSSWAQDFRLSVLGGRGAAAAGTGSPLLQYGLAVSGNDARATAEMIAVRQNRNSSGVITTTRYQERISASGDIEKFQVSFHYESMSTVPDTSGRVQSILDSPSFLGAESIWDLEASTDGASQTASPWYAQ